MNNTQLLLLNASCGLIALDEVCKRAATANITAQPPATTASSATPSIKGMRLGWTPHGGMSFMGLPVGAVPAKTAQPRVATPAPKPVVAPPPLPITPIQNGPQPAYSSSPASSGAGTSLPMTPIDNGPQPAYPGQTPPAHTGTNRPASGGGTVIRTAPVVSRPGTVIR